MNRPFKLHRLQQIDSQLDVMQKRLLQIQEILDQDEALRLSADRSHQAEVGLQQARKQLTRAEQDVLGQRIKIEQSEASLYSGKIKNPKELQDLQNEVSALKRYLDVLEDRQLEAMLSEEEAIAYNSSARLNLEKIQTQFNQQAVELNQEQEKIHKDMIRVQGERQAALSSIPPEDMKIYKKLRDSRHGIAVTIVTDKTCSACGSTLNTALHYAAHSPNQINTCESCGRILYIG